MEALRITDWLGQFIRQQVKSGDLCVDATMGNGNDTALLSTLAGEQGSVIAFDIQELALQRTREKLKAEHCPENVRLLLESHENIGQYAEPGTVSCITFNFGYLPGGDHEKATRPKTSVRAIESGLKLLKKDGLMTLCIYSGGDTGFSERDQILSYLRSLNPKEYLVIVSEYANRPNHPPVPAMVIRL